MMRAILALCLALPAAGPGHANPADTAAAPEKFSVNGKTLRFDTEAGPEDSEIEPADADALRRLLRSTPDITTLALDSSGGSLWAAKEMARIALDFELDTVVDGECSSSCVRIFLAGNRRSVTRGSKIGVHLPNWSPANTEEYYGKWREEEGWDTPFEFASWVYADTYAEAYESLSYAVSRGVAPGFAIEMLAPRRALWFPERAALVAAGVIREAP